MNNIKLSKILVNIESIKINGSTNKEISFLTIDSREAKENSLYFAIKGFQVDGHKFIKSAIKNGASTIIYEDKTFNFYKEYNNVTFILVKNIRKIEAIMAHNFYNNPTSKMKIIGITGTNGKTSTTYILDSIFRSLDTSSGVIGTIGYKIDDKTTTLNNTTPDAIQLVSILDKMQKAGVKVVTMEVSSHALTLYRVWGIQFDLVLWSNLTQDHLDFHKDMDDYYEAKKMLFTSYLSNSSKKDKKILINIDDKYGQRLFNELNEETYTLYSTSIKNKADFKIKDFHLSLDGVLFSLKNKNKEFMFKSSLVGEYNIYNILIAISSGLLLNLPIDYIGLAINKMNQIPGRLENCNIKGRNIFVDYAHTPDAVESVLRTLRPVVSGNLYAIIGAGGDRDKSKRPLMSLASIMYCNILILTSDNPRTENPEKILDDLEKPLIEIEQQKYSFETISDITNNSIVSLSEKSNVKPEGFVYIREVNRRVAIESTLKLLNENDALVICGKGHEDYQIIGKKKIHFSDMEVVKEFYK